MTRSFDATDDYVLLGSGFSSGEALTVSAWVYSLATTTANRYVFCHDPATSNIGHYALSVSSVFNFRMRGTVLSSLTTISTGAWINIAGVGVQNGGSRVYLNGVLDNSTATDNALSGTSVQTIIGAQTTGGTAVWNGYIAHLQIFRGRTLSVNEINQIMRYPGSITRSLEYFPLLGANPEVGWFANSGTGLVVGSTVVSDGPPINGISNVPKPELIHVF